MTTAISWLDDTTVGSWIADEQLTEHGVIGSLVPPRFESYASVRLTGEDAFVINPGRALRQHLVAVLRAHATAVDRCTFALADLYGWDGNATAGSAYLVLETSTEAQPEDLLNAVHARAASSVDPPAAQSAPPLLETRLRSYMLYTGSVDDAGAIADAGGPTEMPDLWWPEDRSWFVATDTDLDFVVVAGPHELASGLGGRGVHVENVTARSWLS